VWTAFESEVELIECSTLTNGTTRREIARTSPHDYSSPDPELATLQVRLDDTGEPAYMRFTPSSTRERMRQAKVRPESSAPIFTVDPSGNSPSSTLIARGSATAVWRSRLRGRAP
jgi:hypothetical protein